MEKRCEFCKALSPIVYCKSDAAYLCLSCDAKVHSANALSYRHPRTLVCESCRYHPALVRCFSHEMFMCQSCDNSHHVSLEHHKKVVSCYVGCPSAKELADLWGFDLKELESNFTVKDQSVDFSLTVDSGSLLVSETDGLISVVYTESERGSTSRLTKVVNDDSQQKISYLIVQQILDLERLQLSEGIENSCLVHVKGRTGGLPFRHDTVWKEHKIIDNHLQQFDGSPLEDKTEEPLSSPFSQMDNLTNTGNPLNGDSFWQYRSPVHNNEIWLQNMQDLGVCDEVQCSDDVHIPDVDLTFPNFEELFGSEQDPNRALVNDENMACAFADQHQAFGKLDRGRASIFEQSNGIDTCDEDHQFQSTNYHPHFMTPSHSSPSFFVSRISGESSDSFDSDNTKFDGKENAIMRYKEKKLYGMKNKRNIRLQDLNPISRNVERVNNRR